ncbi:MAG TPA: glycerol-3-phosphate dehydrogenase/oxidase [Chitinophagaceae bacterium]|nr:glycerol-3-phosphate dehydrogenase/oxidase [Chitinophagaceae bacterium]
MNRDHMIAQLSTPGTWDICVIGGGATGLGVAVDAASRGLRTLLLEKHDFAKGTSSRSTKLVHGGVRYLQQGNIKLVMEALKERGLLLKNAPHLAKNQSFIVPNYKWWEGPYYGLGLKVYDWMSGSLGLGASQLLSREETLALAPTLDPEGLRGGVVYHDGQFDDARLAIHLAMTAADHGATLLNYAPVEGLLKERGRICGVALTDRISGRQYEIRARAVINATGVFTDAILHLDDPAAETMIAPSQGVHLVLDREFLPSAHAIMIPKTDDNRVLFAVPWHNKIIVGTTDTPVQAVSEEPVALHEEVEFILHHIQKYLTKDPGYADIRSQFAGLRPLVKGSSRTTAALSRDHLVTVSDSELITVTGGKWTTYRKMAEDVMEIAVHKAGLPATECRTRDLPIHGYRADTDFEASLYYYGSDETALRDLIREQPDLGQLLHPDLPYLEAEIVWAARRELCMTVEDALARRTRALLLDARAARDAAPRVAGLLARELGRDKDWMDRQVSSFAQLANQYLPTTNP